MLEKITNNMAWKIISIIIAFFLWLVVVNIEDPEKDITLDIVVDKINVESITEDNNTGQKKAIQYIKGEKVKVVVRGKRSVIESLETGDVKAYADMATLSITGAIDIDIQTDKELEIIDVEPSNMEVALEDIIKVQQIITYEAKGEPAEDFVYLEPRISPNTIEVTGAESRIALIDKVVIPINIGGSKRDVALKGTPKVVDISGNEITGLTLSVNEVEVTVPVFKSKTVPIEVRTVGNVPTGYKLISQPTSSLKEVMIIGSEEIIDSYEKLVINDIPINSEEDQVIDVFLEEYLDGDLLIYGDNQYTTVTTDVEKLQTKEVVISAGDINLRNMPDGLQFSFVDDVSISLIFEGIATDLENVSIESLDPYIRLTGLEAGLHEVSLGYYVSYLVNDLSEAKEISILLETIVDKTVEEKNPDDTGSTENIEG